jgi:HAE1 family hydrophobic/amphiphilic exporter-1
MQLIEAFVRNPVKVVVAVILIALFGLIAVFRMPMQLTPEVQIPTLTIETRWPGASPQEVEREIIQEQEEQLKGVEGVIKMTSECMDSTGRIVLEFAVGSDMREALLKVNTRLQQVPEYPEDAKEPVISTSNASDRPIAWFILKPRAATSEEVSAFQQKHPHLALALEPAKGAHNTGLRLRRLRLLAQQHPEVKELLPPDIDVTQYRKFAEDFVEARFERVPGVSNSNVFGGREEEMQVVVDPQRLAARQLTMDDVRRALRGQNQDTSGGDFWEGKRRYVVRTLGQFRSPEQVANAIIARRDNVPVYVRDVAEVQLSHKKPSGLVRQFGTDSIAVNCLRATGANVLDVMEGLRQANRELNAGILKQRGLELEHVYDETEYIYSAVGLVKDDILVGGLLTMAMLLIFLRSGRSTLVIGLVIVISLIGTFLILNLLGRSLNVISLAGLAFAVGMLVDNAIVVLENIYRRHQLGESALQATVQGTKEVWGAILATTLTNLAVFLPVLFVQEEAGQLFRDIALAISAAVGLSLVVSLMIVPVAAIRMLRDPSTTVAAGPHLAATDGPLDGRGEPNPLRPGVRHPSWLRAPRALLQTVLLRPLDAFGRGFLHLVMASNAWLQTSVLARVAVVALFTGGSVWLSYLMLPKVEYLPAGNQNLVFGILLPPPGYNLDQLVEIGERIEAALQPYWDTNDDVVETPEGSRPAIGDFFYVAFGRQVFLGLRSADTLRAGELIPVIRQVAADIPGTFAVAKQASLFEQGLSAGRTVDIEITGPELPKLIALGGRIMGQVQQVVPDAQAFPMPSLDLSSPEMHVVPKWEQAADMGITAVDLGYAVDALIDGAYATDYFMGGDKIDLTIVGRERFARRTQDLENLPIATPTGELVPLGAVANVRLSSGPEQINHRQRQRAITIQVSPPPQIALEDAMQRIQAQIVAPLQESGELEGLYQINLAGTADKLRATWEALRLNLLLALLITYLLMAALFESWLYPFVIIMSVPLGAVGGFAGLWLLNQFILVPLDVITMLGFVILIGTVVNNPILIVEQALVHMREDGLPHRQAILESVRNRIRPIFMTTLTTVIGLLPLVLFPGAGSELYRGLGGVLLGGLTVSTLITLIVVPALFSLTLEAKEGLWQRLRGRAAEPIAVPVVKSRQAMSIS